MIRPTQLTRVALIALFAAAALGAKCAGDGDGGSSLETKRRNIEPNCTTLVGSFPSGFSLLPGDEGLASITLFNSRTTVAFDLDFEPPLLRAPDPIESLPEDSDGDGTADGPQFKAAGFRFPLTPVPGQSTEVGEKLVFVSASNFEEVIFWRPLTGTLRSAAVENPASASAHRADAYPLLPPGGTTAQRTALSTLRCIEANDIGSRPFVDSDEAAIGIEPLCNDSEPSFVTRLTAGTAIAAGRLFVAMSNLRSSGAVTFYPGTVLVYEIDLESQPMHLRPDIDTPVIGVTGFNPTTLTVHRTRSGRELVLVNVTGVIGAGVGDDNVRGEGSIDVIDAERQAVIATIPLGRAGSFNQLARHPSGRVLLVGAASHQRVYGVDLEPLETLDVTPGVDPIARLDGSDPRYPDARIFTGSIDRPPLELPSIQGGPDPDVCSGLTDVAFSDDGFKAFAVDFCDGTLTIIDVDLGGAPPVPVPADRFATRKPHPITAPLVPESLDKIRAPGNVRVRRGVPGIDYEGPDVYFIAGQPEGQLCGVRIDSF